MKVALTYDPSSSNLTTPEGVFIATWAGLAQFETKEDGPGSTIEEICQLKNAGFSAQEIIELKRSEVIK